MYSEKKVTEWLKGSYYHLTILCIKDVTNLGKILAWAIISKTLVLPAL